MVLKEQKPKDDKAYNESIRLKKDFEKEPTTLYEKIKNDINIVKVSNNKNLNYFFKRLNMYKILIKHFYKMLA